MWESCIKMKRNLTLHEKGMYIYWKRTVHCSCGIEQCHYLKHKIWFIHSGLVCIIFLPQSIEKNKCRDFPFTFRLGQGDVIQGWEHGLSNMCIGEIRKLTVPSDLAYGNEGAPPDIHPGATLVFEIELLGIIDEEVNMEEYLDYYEMSHFTGL